jgi:chromosomal replication initiation ATPase DnaA
VDKDRVLSFFSDRVSSARRQYEDFIYEAIGEGRNESFYKPVRGQILGDDRFLGEVEKKLDGKEKPLGRPSFEKILAAVQEVMGVREEEIVSPGRKQEAVFARSILAGVWREFGYRLVDLQSKLRRDVSVLSRLSKISDCPNGRVIKTRICEMLNA